MTSRRLPEGGTLIDRSRPLTFRFDGIEYEAFEGDTLASALLANGIVGGFKSPILRRPRGVYSAGVEEPNAFVEVRKPWFDPIVAATMVELVDGLVAESRAGMGRLPARPNGVPDRRVEHRHAHVELLVIGSGHEGLHPAGVAAERGERVLVVEHHPVMWIGAGTSRLPDGPTYLTRATALGLYDDGYVLVLERAAQLDRLWHVRAKRVILATGTRWFPLVFADNDRPGVMLARAASSYLGLYGVMVGTRVVSFEARTDFLTHSLLQKAGAEIGAAIDPREGARPTGDLSGIRLPILDGWMVVSTEGSDAITAIHARGPDGETRTIECDALLVSGGLVPNLDLWRTIGGTTRYDALLGYFLPDIGPPWLSVVGSAAGDDIGEQKILPFVPADDYTHHFVDLQRDQTVADIAEALDGGLRSVEHVKRATYIGTAIDQGRTSGVLAAEIVNALAGGGAAGAQGQTSARPPSVPVSYSTFAGPYRDELLDPVRRTPMDAWHVEHGAVFEDVGQWKRPRYFSRIGESMDEVVARECLAVRNGVGALDATTLGKIEVVGPDAAEFLDRMYTNRMSTLGVGRIRYGLMLGVDGMVVDDGVAMRLAEDRFLVFTTTSGAAIVMDRFEEWLQTEWPELRVYCTSVTEQWAVVSVAGPRARDVVAEAGTDIDLTPEAFPFMSFRDGAVAGVPARVARVSFTGELSFEIDVNGWDGPAVWDAVMAAGERFGITPFGTETMHVLRAEKGYVIVGQDTDGTVTPHDLGMSWLVRNDESDFVGRRSLRRADLVRQDRKQLVGLLPERVLPEGAQLVAEDTGRIPMAMIGHVTSSYDSAALKRPIALAMLEQGQSLHGSTVYSPLASGPVPAEVVSSVFYDPEGARLHG